MARGRRYYNKSLVSSAATSAVSSAVSTPISSRYPSRASSPGPTEPFRFFDLPSELRLGIYELVLVRNEVLDLHPLNYRYLHPLLGLFLASRRMHEEAYRVFYSQPIRLYPTHGRFFHDKQPLLERLPPRYRAAVNTLELRLGPGCLHKPPRSMHTKPCLGLADCSNLRTLKLFVEVDPSDPVFSGFRYGATEDAWQRFCLNLLVGIIEQSPVLEIIEIDAFPGVKKDAPLVLALKRKVQELGKRLSFGPLRGWEKGPYEPGLIGLEQAMAGMGLGDTASKVVAVQA